ncbi:MAG TPA: peptidoglycan-binding protein, partial [Dokdonella sp.]
ITARYHLTPLDAAETEAYVRHRLAVAGCARIPFSRLGLKALYQRSGGIPRLVNIIADRALMAGYAREQDSIGERLVNRAADEALPGHTRYWLHRYGRWATAAAVLFAIAAGAWWWGNRAPAPAFVPAGTPAVAAPARDEGVERLQAQLATKPVDTALSAFTQLLARWQVDAGSVSVREASRCPPQVAPGIACLRGRASIEQLARFDRPLILLLGEDASGHALLQGVGKQKLRLDLAGARHEFALAALPTLWNGEFIALWRVPPELPPTLARGASGAGVAWVMDRLHAFDNGPATAAAPIFDAALEQRVRALQVAYGIRDDGIVGPETQFALSALDDSGPHLARTLQ